MLLLPVIIEVTHLVSCNLIPGDVNVTALLTHWLGTLLSFYLQQKAGTLIWSKTNSDEGSSCRNNFLRHHGTILKLYILNGMLFQIFLRYSVMPNSVWPHGLYPSSLLCPWDSPRKNTRVGCLSLPRGSSRPRA